MFDLKRVLPSDGKLINISYDLSAHGEDDIIVKPLLGCLLLCNRPLFASYILRQRLHGTGSIWNRYEIGTDKPCVYTGPGGSGTDRICYLVPNGPTYEGDPTWNHTVPVSNRSL